LFGSTNLDDNNNIIKKVKQNMMILTLLLLMISWVSGDRVWFNDNTDTQLVIDQDYNDHNIFIVNGTTVSLDNGYAITAPSKTDDGEDAIELRMLPSLLIMELLKVVLK